MTIQEHYSLSELNTFQIESVARYFTSVSSIAELEQALAFSKSEQLDVLFLGGGSNILLCKNFDGLVIKNNFKGFDIIAEDEDSVVVKIGAGENWHQTVVRTVDMGYGGIENLSLIPGLVGAAPIQNIGAYGVEVKDCLIAVGYFDLNDQKEKSISSQECQFGYRTSVFKTKLKNQILITDVTLKFTKKNHQLNVSYGAIMDTLQSKNINSPRIKDISDAVIEIRQSKLPDPKEIGNAGSFFKNPVLSKSHFDAVKQKFGSIKYYDLPDGKVKVPAGWLIEQCGFKGKVFGNTGSHANQALVIVNHGGATGLEIKHYAESIMDKVYDTFSISLEPEVNWIGC